MTSLYVRRIGVWSVFKFSLVLYLILFVLEMVFLGITFLVFSLSAQSLNTNPAYLDDIQAILGGGLVAFIITGVVSLIMVLVGAACNAIGALIYNLIAWMSGGIELRTEQG